MDQRVIDLYNDYIHGNMPRRDFMKRLAGVAGSVDATEGTGTGGGIGGVTARQLLFFGQRRPNQLGATHKPRHIFGN